ncbi:Sugar phosphate isomerase/epimerase [Desulfocicer vacuolatum DSM 3385]|uniref:Sugar phosphate isomerase/epimerase n=1 Tax=Desulfocicer vacuolatum DSM 3385 TaxID=1121400 RepID=A0A1W2CJS2_9BACT|nr:cobamide remodeling phosphodiesterase CbiR [Desulfocicer vacuolatum]SMC85487.1 Sugar phosphate isomerase/epimerase [Desulfocicer vacuolatum DSM 3385]
MMIEKKWPFKVGTTSFIDPGTIVDNVKKLGPVFDEIELLVFESRPFMTKNGPVPALPREDEIRELAQLSQELGVTYNIHLPVDVSLTSDSKTERMLGVDTIKQVVALCAPLSPSTHTLHLEFTPEDAAKGDVGVAKWQDRALESLGILCPFLNHPSDISIETLEYPPEHLYKILDSMDVALCIDAGHLIKYNYDITALFQRYGHRVPLIHLHGVDFSHEPPRDHQGLDKTPMDRFLPTLEVLKQFDGVVSLEVFNGNNLKNSINYLNRL